MDEFGVPYDVIIVCYTKQTPDMNYQRDNPPTAILCGNDRTAMACYGAHSDLGLRIPTDVAVVGYASQLDIAQGLWFPLTTVQLQHCEMGKWAVEYLLSTKHNHANLSNID